jgi:hypothetical protein
MIAGNYSRNENYQVARDVGGEEPTESMKVMMSQLPAMRLSTVGRSIIAKD